MSEQSRLNLSLRLEFGFAVGFIAFFAAMQYGYSLCRDTALEHIIIDLMTVKPSVALINLMAPDEHAIALGHSLISRWVRLNVLNGCEGLESMFLVVAAMMAYALPLTKKIKGALWAVVMVYGLNQLRIVALYFTAHYRRDLFTLLHGYVGPTIIILFGTLFFLWWISRHQEGELKL